MQNHLIYTSGIELFLSACGGYGPTTAVDSGKVNNTAKYNEDKVRCITLAKTIDLNSEAVLKAFGRAAAGGVAVTGGAMAVAGIVGSVLGGSCKCHVT